MTKFMITIFAFTLFAASTSFAQTTNSGAAVKPTTTRTQSSGSAPVGHRQPTAADVANDSSASSAISAEDRALDRKIKGICKGC